MYAYNITFDCKTTARRIFTYPISAFVHPMKHLTPVQKNDETKNTNRSPCTNQPYMVYLGKSFPSQFITHNKKTFRNNL